VEYIFFADFWHLRTFLVTGLQEKCGQLRPRPVRVRVKNIDLYIMCQKYVPPYFGLVGQSLDWWDIQELDWWDIQELDKDMTVEETRNLGIMDKDGVNLDTRACRCAAVSLCDRFLRENETALDKREKGKRRRLL
jgi:hypothetical protein